MTLTLRAHSIFRGCQLALLAGLGYGAVQSFGHEVEILVGRSAAGQLKVQIETEHPIPLPVSIFPGITGYATGSVGIHSIILDEPTNDFFQISAAADVRFILMAKDPGIEVWNDTGSGYMGIGESFLIGVAPFDTHPIWNILPAPATNVYSLTLRMHDVNGVYTDSDPVAIEFAPVLPAQLSIADDTNGTVSVIVSGTPGGEYVLQASTNLQAIGSWTSVATNELDADGTWTFTESKVGRSQRFYRCAVP